LIRFFICKGCFWGRKRFGLSCGHCNWWRHYSKWCLPSASTAMRFWKCR